MPDPQISLVLPAYNEARRIADTITQAKSYFNSRSFSYEIIVSADGTDGTREIVTEMAKTDPTLSVIGNIARMGKGHGVRQAVHRAQGDIVGFADADNKTPIDELDKVIPLLTQQYDLVIGSRALADSQIERPQPFYRQLGSKGFGIFMHLVVGLHDVIDTQCGFKFFKRQIAHDLFTRQKIDGYMFDVEILYLAQKAGYKLAQVPVRWRDDGDSRLQLLSGNLRNVLDIFRIRFTSVDDTVRNATITNS
jgi:dolichyl-phosphate beta-glucosyltransferase